MVALEDGKITPDTEVDTGNGIMNMYGSKMRDHNWHRGGYGKIDVTRILEVSSNVGVSYLIDKHYKDNPQKFVDGLKRMSIDQPLHLQIPGEGKPNIKGPKERYFAKNDFAVDEYRLRNPGTSHKHTDLLQCHSQQRGHGTPQICESSGKGR